MDATLKADELREKLISILLAQGFNVSGDAVHTTNSEALTTEQKRDIHLIATNDKLHKHRDFLIKNIPVVQKYMVDGENIDVAKIRPVLRLVESGSEDETIFKWWNLAWWSLPYERAYGRQMRFIVWDEYHDSPMGLIGLQSPILQWRARDEYLGLVYENRDYWVNQSMSAQRLGALPPYNFLLGGKLVGMMLTADTVREAFEKKYKDRRTLLQGRILPANLLFVTTTGAFGKSSVYDRLKYDGHKVVEHIGMTKGNGTFHIPDSLYDELVGFLSANGVDTKRGYGGGPSKKMKLIGQAMSLLGIKRGSLHGLKRAVYLFPFASNIKQVIANDSTPDWYCRDEQAMANFWKARWAIPRSKRDETYRSFKQQTVIDELMDVLESRHG